MKKKSENDEVMGKKKGGGEGNNSCEKIYQ